uniref:Cysteine rich protein 1 n=1 Tax=Ursus americanus TaxID=9643 RepID=A0A452R2V9_URSAM
GHSSGPPSGAGSGNYVRRRRAERVTSLGKDWHRPCLKCEKCGKTLTSGGHAEHEGKPYCNHPCYASMFGPKGRLPRPLTPPPPPRPWTP